MVLKAAARHELVDKETLFVLAAVADQFYQMRMPELPQKYDLRLLPYFPCLIKFLLLYIFSKYNGQLIKPSFTSHSRCPCSPPTSNSLTATGCALRPGRILSSTKPLCTVPNPPSPSKKWLEKSWVITRSSMRWKAYSPAPTDATAASSSLLVFSRRNAVNSATFLEKKSTRVGRHRLRLPTATCSSAVQHLAAATGRQGLVGILLWLIRRIEN